MEQPKDLFEQYIETIEAMPTHVLVHPNAINGLKTASIVLAEQVVTIPKKRLLAFLGALDKETLGLIGQARRTQSPFHSL